MLLRTILYRSQKLRIILNFFYEYPCALEPGNTDSGGGEWVRAEASLQGGGGVGGWKLEIESI